MQEDCSPPLYRSVTIPRCYTCTINYGWAFSISCTYMRILWMWCVRQLGNKHRRLGYESVETVDYIGRSWCYDGLRNAPHIYLKWNSFYVEVLLMATWHCVHSYLQVPEQHRYMAHYLCAGFPMGTIIQVVLETHTPPNVYAHWALFRENIIISRQVKSKLVLFCSVCLYLFCG